MIMENVDDYVICRCVKNEKYGVMTSPTEATE